MYYTPIYPRKLVSSVLTAATASLHRKFPATYTETFSTILKGERHCVNCYHHAFRTIIYPCKRDKDREYFAKWIITKYGKNRGFRGGDYAEVPSYYEFFKIEALYSYLKWDHRLLRKFGFFVNILLYPPLSLLEVSCSPLDMRINFCFYVELQNKSLHDL